MSKEKKTIRILNVKNQKSLADKCLVAETFFDRLKGLLGTKVLNRGAGLLLRPCNDIHMWFMSIPIDVVFAKKKQDSKSGQETYQVTSVHKNVKPWRILPLRDGRAQVTFELPVGAVDLCEVREGDILCIN